MTPQSDSKPQSRHFSPIVLIFLALPLIGIVIALVMLSGERNLNSPEGAAVEQTYTTTGWQAEDFALPALEGDTTIQLSDYRGRVVFVNFWATDCVPCVRELPAFEAFMREQSSAGENAPVILAVNGAESPDTISTFLASIDVSSSAFPIALDRDLSIRQSYGVVALPTTFVIDAEGMVRSRKLGEITLENLREYVAQLS